MGQVEAPAIGFVATAVPVKMDVLGIEPKTSCSRIGDAKQARYHCATRPYFRRQYQTRVIPRAVDSTLLDALSTMR